MHNTYLKKVPHRGLGGPEARNIWLGKQGTALCRRWHCMYCHCLSPSSCYVFVERIPTEPEGGCRPWLYMINWWFLQVSICMSWYHKMNKAWSKTFHIQIPGGSVSRGRERKSWALPIGITSTGRGSAGRRWEIVSMRCKAQVAMLWDPGGKA